MSDAICAGTAVSLARLVSGDNRPLVPGDLACLYEMIERNDSCGLPAQLATLQKTQLAYKLGLLLVRILDQHKVRPFGWQREGYCSMVETSAQGTCSVLGCAADSDNRSRPHTPAQRSAELVVVQQITASGLLPKLAAALSKLAYMMQTTQQTSPPYKSAALALLQLALHLIAVWPGMGRVLTSAAASAIVVPAVQLAAAMVQHDITASDSCNEDSGVALGSACRLVLHLGAVILEARRRHARVAVALQGWSVIKSCLASSVFQHLVLTVLAVVTDPNIIPDMFCRGNVKHISTSAAVDDQQSAAVAASEAVQPPQAADTTSSASIPAAVTSSTTEHGGDADGTAAQLVQALCQQQRLLLTMLYPALGSSSKWADFAATSAAALSHVQLSFQGFEYITEAAITCFKPPSDAPHNAGEGVTTSGSSSRTQGQASRTAASTMTGSSLDVLPQLQVLLLQWAYVAASNPVAYSSRFAVYEAVSVVSSCAIRYWEFHLLQNSAKPHDSEKVIRRDQLPAPHITDLLLQNLRLLLQQQQQAVAQKALTLTPSEAARPHSSSAAAPTLDTTTAFDEMVGTGSLCHLSLLVSDLKPFTHTAVWQSVSKELYATLEWWLRVGSSSHEELQPQQPQCSAAPSSSSSAAYVAVQWNDTPQLMELFDNGQLSGRIWSYHHLIKSCEVWLYPTTTVYQVDDSAINYESALLPYAAAAAPGSFEQQQLLTLLISLLKRSSSTNGLLTIMADDPPGAVPIGCELGSVMAATSRMLDLCGPCGSSGSLGIPYTNRALQDSSNTQNTCATTADTTGSSGSSSTTTSAGCSSTRSTGDSQAVNVTAAAPWLVVAARALINKSERLSGCLEYQPVVADLHSALNELHQALSKMTNAAMLSSSDPADVVDIATCAAGLAKVKPMFSDESLKLFDYLQPVLHWTECVRPIISVLEDALVGLQGAASSSTIMNRLAFAADSGSSSPAHLDAGPVVAGEVLPETAAKPVVTVSSLQQVQFGSALQQLQRSLLKLEQLSDMCSMMTPMCYMLIELAPADWLRKVSKLGLATEVVETLKTAKKIDEFKAALQLWGVQQFQQQLTEAGQLVCAALPLKYFCNNPMCRNLSKSTEGDLVNGKNCVCAGCETARYCSGDCQVAHWPWHKVACKVIKKQNKSHSN